MFINLLAPINNLGYGYTGFNVLKALNKAGHRVSLFPISPLRDEDVKPFFKDIEIIKAGLLNAKTYNAVSPSLRIWHQNELDKFVGCGERIGWPIFELDTFTEQEIHHLSNVDRLFVCSKWAKEILRKNGVTTVPINVVPLGVDLDVFYIDKEAQNSRPYYTRNTTVFINIGKWEKRKGHEELLEAFSKAFTLEDDVQLWMMNDNPFIGAQGNEAWKRKYISSPMGAKIKILRRLPTQDDMRVLFNHVDFGVFPSHAEGWNLEILELMACGVPSIATNYSGHTEFLTSMNSFLVEPTGMESAQDGVWFHGQGNWCTFNVDDLVDQMRIAHELKQNEVRNLSGKHEILYSGALGRRIFECYDTVKKFTWDKSIEKMIEVL